MHRKKLNEIYYTLNIVRIFANNIQDMEEKKDYTALLPALISAVDGATSIDEELKENKSAVAGTVSYHLGEIAGLFI